MKNIFIGKTDLTPSKLSFGGAPIGELFQKLTDKNCYNTLELCYQNGVNIFDTSPFYGLGLSEKRLGNFFCKLKPTCFA